jgi:hypothetical protein
MFSPVVDQKHPHSRDSRRLPIVADELSFINKTGTFYRQFARAAPCERHAPRIKGAMPVIRFQA